jgi:hypothetical protein
VKEIFEPSKAIAVYVLAFPEMFVFLAVDSTSTTLNPTVAQAARALAVPPAAAAEVAS